MGVCATLQQTNIVETLQRPPSFSNVLRTSSTTSSPSRPRTFRDNAPGLPLGWYGPLEYIPLSQVDVSTDWHALQAHREREALKLQEVLEVYADLPDSDLEDEGEDLFGVGPSAPMQDPGARFREILSKTTFSQRDAHIDALRRFYAYLHLPCSTWKTDTQRRMLTPSSLSFLHNEIVKEAESSFKFIDETVASDLLPSMPPKLLRNLELEAEWRIAIAKKVSKVQVYLAIVHIRAALKIYEERLGNGLFTDSMDWGYDTLVSTFRNQDQPELANFWTAKKQRAMLRHHAHRARLCEERSEWEIAVRLYQEALQEVQFDETLEDDYLDDPDVDVPGPKCCLSTRKVLAALARCHMHLDDIGRARLWLCRYLRQIRHPIVDVLPTDADRVESVRLWIVHTEAEEKNRAMTEALQRIRRVLPKKKKKHVSGSGRGNRRNLPSVKSALRRHVGVDLAAERRLEAQIESETTAKRSGLVPFVYEKLAVRLSERKQYQKAIGMYEKGVASYFGHLMCGRLTRRALDSHFFKLEEMVHSLLDLLIGERDYVKSLVYNENFKLFKLKCLAKHGHLHLPSAEDCSISALSKLEYVDIRSIRAQFEENSEVHCMVIYRLHANILHIWVFVKTPDPEEEGAFRTRVVFKKIEMESEQSQKWFNSSSVTSSSSCGINEDVLCEQYEVFIQRIKKYFPTSLARRLVFVLDQRMNSFHLHSLKCPESGRNLLMDNSIEIFDSIGLMHFLSNQNKPRPPPLVGHPRLIQLALIVGDEMEKSAYASGIAHDASSIPTFVPLEQDPSQFPLEGDPFDLIVQTAGLVDGVPPAFQNPGIVVVHSSSPSIVEDWVLAGATAVVFVADAERVEEVGKKIMANRGRARTVLLSYLRHEDDVGLLRFRGFDL